jgi:hypothetical protein
MVVEKNVGITERFFTTTIQLRRLISGNSAHCKMNQPIMSATGGNSQLLNQRAGDNDRISVHLFWG